MADYAGLIEERLTEAQIAAAVAILVGAAEAYDKEGDGDATPMIDDIIAGCEEKLSNYTDNMNRLITSLKEKRDAARRPQES